MKSCFLLSGLICLYSVCSAQDTSSIAAVRKLMDEEKYIEVIDKYADTTRNYPAKTLFYIAWAYYLKSDDAHCIQFADLSLAKDPSAPETYSLKGATLNYMERYEEAIQSFKSAIRLDSSNARFYSGLGDSYYSLKKTALALETYLKATGKENCPERPYIMVAQIYAEQKKYEEALNAYYAAMEKIGADAEDYARLLYNTALMEMLTDRFDRAELNLKKLLQSTPDDFQACSKLIQIYYHRQDYEKAIPLKEKMYKARYDGVLPENIRDMFCIDQFRWKDKLVQVFERYEGGPSENIFFKHLFYVVNDNDEIEFRIQTEYSPVAAEIGGAPYVLGMSKDQSHFTFPIGFNENARYEDIRKSVVDILEERLKPVSSSRAGGR